MTMVGLFWITEDHVFVGAEPTGAAPGVRLTEDGVQCLGTDQGASWTWPEIRGLDVRDVAVRSPARRLVAIAADWVDVLLTTHVDQPPLFTVAVTTADGTVEADALTAAPSGVHTTAEYDLSRTLLARLATGTGTVGPPLAWRRARQDTGNPSRAEREDLLRAWADGGPVPTR
ncbi:hypothetical protein [Streptomyces sp. NPDC000134]|uniref:hypothetical protein n=1 Tax=Streptomyces sp. NPDC000134 TaxID=3364536 RepID=UPI0036877C99